MSPLRGSSPGLTRGIVLEFNSREKKTRSSRLPTDSVRFEEWLLSPFFLFSWKMSEINLIDYANLHSVHKISPAEIIDSLTPYTLGDIPFFSRSCTRKYLITFIILPASYYYTLLFCYMTIVSRSQTPAPLFVSIFCGGSSC